ncbi:DinB family protein [Saccharothrix violaceirubra]|uniref:Putative damage-inducible protein DinB n=1 Tax=Saccharothrix violaceirubra TaxID=413306 RepID=A0A7W7T2L2_9PSEU|nr:DinB family protein [Saccharothrix violaceirubra]MBB4965081.1 putative damage-inducible protein DinB [Saccharothrix violaceirubra]
MTTPKEDLHNYLRVGREAILWKLDGLSEYDVRRPLTPTGTNLLGLVKHLALVESGYFGATFGRPFPREEPWMTDETELNIDMYAKADESREHIVGLYKEVWAHSDETIESLPLDAPGTVPWWAEDKRQVTLHRILSHVIAETHRHAGHADIVRELIDGFVGHRQGTDNMATHEESWWVSYREKVEQEARAAGAS